MFSPFKTVGTLPYFDNFFNGLLTSHNQDETNDISYVKTHETIGCTRKHVILMQSNKSNGNSFLSNKKITIR